MDPTLWSRLPRDILPVIIENTADPKTLKIWREATKLSIHLPNVAIRTSYSTFTVFEKDLLRAPSTTRHHEWHASLTDDEASDCTPSGAERPIHQLVLDLRRCFYQTLAPRVRRLCLQFYFASSDRRENLVRSEDVRHTLDTILPRAKALQEMDHHGVLYQEELDGFLEVRLLKVLRVRQSWIDTPCLCSEGNSPRPVGLWALDWSRLFHLHALKTLSVSQLTIYEAWGLGKAIKKLKRLESLRVEIAKIDIRAANTLSDDEDGLPLMTFMDALYRREEGHANDDLGFPPSLKALALVDLHYGHLDISKLPKNLITHLPNLTRLYLDLFHSADMTDLFAFLNPYRLMQLLVSAYPKPEIRLGSVYKACHRCDTFSALLGQNSNTFQEITLLDAWRDTREDSREKRPPWVPEMQLQQIYISKPTGRSGRRMRTLPQIVDTLAWRLHGGLRFGQIDFKIWGEGVRHMRIDQLDLGKLQVSNIDQAVDKFGQLKILVLRSLPEQERYEPSEKVTRSSEFLYPPPGPSVLRSKPYPHLPFGPTLPEDMNALKEGRIAREIATQDLPSLRVIVVGEYKFWLQRMTEDNNHDDRRPKVWFLRHALENASQEAVIGQILDRDDWNFVADREDCLLMRAPMEQVHWANRLVYRSRVEKVDGLGD